MKDIDEIVRRMTLDEKIAISSGATSWTTLAIPRLGVPSIRLSDGTNGVRFQKNSDNARESTFFEKLNYSFDSKSAVANTYPATCFPSGSAIACSWNRKLVYDLASAIAHECKVLDIQLLLGPGMNIRRHPLTARNFEYYSEDPVLSGDLAAAFVDGLQSHGVGACVKHFACHNSDNRRTRLNIRVSERALNEIYLEGFRRVVRQTSPVALMTSYNKVNGVDMCADNTLVKDVLKGDWQYPGTVICDFGGIKDIIKASEGLIDLQMPKVRISPTVLRKAIEDGSLSEKVLDERIRKILRLVFSIGELDKKAAGLDDDFPDHHALAVKAASESIVLLKNERALLPIEKKEGVKIAVIGMLAQEPLFQGTGCAVVNAQCVDIPYDEIVKNCQGAADVAYAQGYLADGSSSEALFQQACNTAERADIAIVFVGSSLPRETDDYNRKDMQLCPSHNKLVHAVASVQKKTIVVVAGGDVSELHWCKDVPVIIATWFSGEGMGKALADILFGNINPSGKLSATVPVRLCDTPSYLSFYDTPLDVDYGEGIFVGYRYYDRKGIAPLFPFGYGLSYTSFQFSELGIGVDKETKSIVVTVCVANIGKLAGAEVVQLYVRQPNASQLRPLRELKGFEKVYLENGESRKIEFSLSYEDLGFYHQEYHKWFTENGTYIIEIGNSSRDIKLNQSVHIDDQILPRRKVDWDCGFRELFEAPEAEELVWNFMKRFGLLDEQQINEQVKEKLMNTFWSIRSFFDLRSSQVSFADVDELINEINEKIGMKR